jgi:large subunit ribosomal protein L15
MDLSNLKPASGSVKKGKRIGRGQGSGRGGTSTKGHNGAQSRSGYSRKVGFEGGQMPLQRRIPKFGFRNINRVEYASVNLDVLQQIADDLKITKIDKDVLLQKNLIHKKDLIKILGRGELNSSLEIHAHKFSESAKGAIEKAGGSANTIEK